MARPRRLAAHPRRAAVAQRLRGLGRRVWGLGFRVWGSGGRVQGSGCGGWGFEFGVWGLRARGCGTADGGGVAGRRSERRWVRGRSGWSTPIRIRSYRTNNDHANAKIHVRVPGTRQRWHMAGAGKVRGCCVMGVRDRRPRSSECGTYKTAKARCWPWLSDQSPQIFKGVAS